MESTRRDAVVAGHALERMRREERRERAMDEEWATEEEARRSEVVVRTGARRAPMFNQ